MEPHSIPKVKTILRKISLDEAKKMADHVLSLTSPDEINRFVADEMRSKFPFDFDRDLNFEEKLKPVVKNSN